MSGQHKLSCRCALLAVLAFAGAAGGRADDGFRKAGAQYDPVGRIPGDQVHVAAAYLNGRGYLVWQDNATDGSGLGIGARRLGQNVTAEFGNLRVNQVAAGDQENPRVAVLPGDGAVIVWQGGTPGNQRIVARVIGRTGTFATGDILVSPSSQGQCERPSLTVLNDGSVAVAWTALDADGDMAGIFTRRLSTKGDLLGDAVQVNETTPFNQRDAAMATLSDGSYVILWVSEFVSELRGQIFSDLYARRFNGDGTPAGSETRLNSGSALCAQADVVALAAGGYVAVWPQLDRSRENDGWDIVSRSFKADGSAQVPLSVVNTHTSGHQHTPVVTGVTGALLVAWVSEGQDGSREGIFGRALDLNGQPNGDEFAVNTVTAGPQIHPAVVGTGSRDALVLWSSYTQVEFGVDLNAQRLTGVAPALAAPAPALTAPLSSTRFSVSWPAIDGLAVESYTVTFDGATTVVTSNNFCLSPSFLPGSVHSVTYGVRLRDGRLSPNAPVVEGRTWGEDLNSDGIPDDWQELHWGLLDVAWPGGDIDSDGDGVTNLREFLAGTNPTDPASALKTRIIATSQGPRLAWNCVPGLIYQIEESGDLKSWSRSGQPRLALDTEDSVALSEGSRLSYFRIVRVR